MHQAHHELRRQYRQLMHDCHASHAKITELQERSRQVQMLKFGKVNGC